MIQHTWNNATDLHENLISFDNNFSDITTRMGITYKSEFRLIVSNDDNEDPYKNNWDGSFIYYSKDQLVKLIKNRIIELKQRLMITFINGMKSSESLHNFEDNQLFDKNLIPIIFNYVAY